MSQPSYGGSHGGGASSSGGPSSMSPSSSDDKVRPSLRVSASRARAVRQRARGARVPQNLHLDAVEAATLIRLNGFQRTLEHAVKIQDIPVIVTLVRARETGAGRGYPSLFACTRGAPSHRALYAPPAAGVAALCDLPRKRAVVPPLRLHRVRGA